MIADLRQQFEEFIQRTKAEVIDTSALPAGPCSKSISRPSRRSALGTRSQKFPDAFVVHGLVEWTKENAEPLYVVSGDKPFRHACQPYKTLNEYATLSTLLDRIIVDDPVGDFIRDQILERIEDIKENAKQEFEDRLYNVDNEDGDAEMSLQSLKLDSQPEIIEADDDSAMVEIHFKGNFDAHLSYYDSSTGMYDNETKSMICMEYKREPWTRRRSSSSR